MFLSTGRCPVIPNAGLCFSHPGSYFASLSLQTDSGQRLLVTAGSAGQGFASVELDGVELMGGGKGMKSVGQGGDMKTGMTGLHVTLLDAYHVTVSSGVWQLRLDNSDGFLNVQEVAVTDWTHLHTQDTQHSPHGLLGQTWQTREERQARGEDTLDKHSRGGPQDIEGDVDDYAVLDADIWGVNTDSPFNRFAPATTRT